MNFRRNCSELTTNKSGVALVISLVIVSIFTLMIITLQMKVIPYMRRNAARESSDTAEMTLKSAKNVGAWEASTLRIGENLDLSYTCYNDEQQLATGSGDGSGEPLCDYYKQLFSVEVLSDCVKTSDGTACKSGDRYLIPAPGTGNAGENCQITTNYSGALDVNEDIVKPCNWNKLKFGETDAIPLYIDDGDPATPNVADPDLSSFTIKVRTPCEEIVYEADGKRLKGTLTPGLDHPEDEWCGEETGVNRHDLYDSTDYNVGSDVIVYWQITGNCEYVPAVGHETADDRFNGNCTAMGVGESVDEEDPSVWSLINKDVINDARDPFIGIDYGVVGDDAEGDRNKIDDLNITSNLVGEFPTIVDYITDELDFNRYHLPNYPNITSRTLADPVLYLSVVSPITINPDGGVAPYVEYQIESDVKLPTPYQTIRASGTWGIHTFADTVYRKILKATPQFVITN